MRARTKNCEPLRDLIKQFVSAKLVILQFRNWKHLLRKAISFKQILSYNKLNKLTSVFYASVLLSKINCVITLSKWLWKMAISIWRWRSWLCCKNLHRDTMKRKRAIWNRKIGREVRATGSKPYSCILFSPNFRALGRACDVATWNTRAVRMRNNRYRDSL